MIDFLLVFNTQGKVRFSKWYRSHSEGEKRRIISECYRLVQTRDNFCTNFMQFNQGTLVYQRYASLYVCTQVDSDDNELAGLEAIQFFVEALNAEFKGVCESDLIYHFWKVYAITDEIFCAGEMMESNKKVIAENVSALQVNTSS